MGHSKYKVVLTDCPSGLDLHIQKEMLKKVGAQLVVCNCQTEEDVVRACKGADVVWVVYAKLSRLVIQSLRKCKAIVRYGIGIDMIDVQAATEHGIMVANVPGYCVNEVAVHTVALILNCARKITLYDESVRHRRQWNPEIAVPISRLKAKTLGLVGFGKIAQAVVPIVKGFDFLILAHDPYMEESLFRRYGVSPVGFDDLLKSSDFISIHIPLTRETKHMIGERELKLMKRTTFLINTARGEIIEEQVLHKALTHHWIAGAALDVLQQEPPTKDNPLLDLENVIITPHAASYSEESFGEMYRKVAEQTISILKGKCPQYLVNPDVRERLCHD